MQNLLCIQEVLQETPMQPDLGFIFFQGST